MASEYHAPTAIEMVRSAYSQVEGYKDLENIGLMILTLALSVHLVIQLYRAMRGGQADWIQPLVTIGLAVIIVKSLLPIGTWISEAFYLASDAVFRQDLTKLAASAWTVALKGVTDPGITDYLAAIFSPTAWLGVMVFFGLQTVLIVKMVVLDVIWPVALGAVVMGGAIVLPFGVLFGGGIKGWAKLVLEIATWPLIFQVLTTLLFGVMAGQLKHIQKLEGVWEKAKMVEFYEDEFGKDSEGAKEARKDLYEQHGITKDEVDGVLFTFINFLAINVAYVFIVIGTPIIAHIMMSSTAAQGIGARAMAGFALLGAAASRRRGGSSASGGKGAGGTSSGGGQSNQSDGQGDKNKDLDKR